jgi:hypothetical protein
LSIADPRRAIVTDSRAVKEAGVHNGWARNAINHLAILNQHIDREGATADVNNPQADVVRH